MTDEEPTGYVREEGRSVLGCRVHNDTQKRFKKYVHETMGNRRGAYGYAVERAMEEYMDQDRYARLEDRMDGIEETIKHTNALVRKIVTAEKEKGAFLESPATGNSVGSRQQREDKVIEELVRRHENGHKVVFPESEVNEVIVEVAGVSSTPSKRSYREALVDRDLLTVNYAKYALTNKALEFVSV